MTDPSLGFLFAAFFITWLVLLLYLLVLSGRLNALRREVDALRRQEESQQEKVSDVSPPGRPPES